DDPRHVANRDVGIVRVPQGDLPVGLEVREQLAVGEVAALAVLDRHRQPLPGLAAARERSVGPLDEYGNVTTDEGQGRVRPERPGKETRFAQNLKTIADPEHQPTLGGEAGDAVHD